MISYITNRNIRVYNADNQISHNSDYIAKFVFDDEWNGKIKTARFIQDNEHFDVILVNDKCKIPPLKNGHIKIGVFTDSMTSTYADVYFKTSIKDGIDSPEPPEGVYEQLITLIESGILKGDDGLTPYVGSNNNWWIGDIDTGVLARGTDGEDGYTPVKGVDYFTEEEIQQIQNEVSGGAIGDFEAVVDEETATFNANAENTLTGYNANAQEKFETYNANANSKFSDYNTNAEEKFSKYTSNAEAKLSEYNQNDSKKTEAYNRNAAEKLEAYSQNHTEKVAEYNANAETKTAEFDANAAALQTEVDRLRGECDNLAAENRKQENKIGALIKLNKGQTYDILLENGESASRTAPSGTKYVSVDKVGGKSIVWNQLFNMSQSKRVDGGQFEINFESQTVTLNGNSGNNAWLSVIPDDGEYKALNVRNHQYIYVISVVENQSAERVTFGWLNRVRHSTSIPANYTGRANFVCTVTKPEEGKSIGFSELKPNTHYALKIVLTACDLTLLFGAGNEPTAEQFERMFPADVYPYNPGEIISSRTETITAGAESITTGFPELHSAGIAHDEIDMDSGAIRRSVGVVDLGTLDWTYNSEYKFMFVAVDGKRAGHNNIIIPRYNLSPDKLWQQDTDRVCGGNDQNNIIYIKDLKYSDPAAFKAAIKGVMLHYELATPTTEPVTIPEPLQEWLPVEAGGTVTFRNADETKQLPVPNAVSWVRKLNEVE